MMYYLLDKDQKVIEESVDGTFSNTGVFKIKSTTRPQEPDLQRPVFVFPTVKTWDFDKLTGRQRKVIRDAYEKKQSAKLLKYIPQYGVAAVKGCCSSVDNIYLKVKQAIDNGSL